MKNKSWVSKFFRNDKAVLALSFVLAIVVWLMVVINVSPETSRVIKNVKVTIDTSVPSQFGLKVFGTSDFYVDVTVTGKKYLISNAALTSDDIVVTAQTNNVDSAGKRSLSLKAEPASDAAEFTISSLSETTIDVYFDMAKSVQMVIEPDIVADGFDIAAKGYTTGDINLSESSVTVSGPATEVNKVAKIVARVKLDAPLTANKSADAELMALDSNGSASFDYVTMNLSKVSVTIPVLQVKKVKTSVTFKNAPDSYVLKPLRYTISPASDYFKVSVDDYAKTKSVSVGTIDFRYLSPTNHVFTFDAEDTAHASGSSDTEKYTVSVDVSGLDQEYFTIAKSKITVNNPDKVDYTVSALNKSVVIVGKKTALENITEDNITVEADLSTLSIKKGQSVIVPVAVTVKSGNCWVYGTYSVEVSR